LDALLDVLFDVFLALNETSPGAQWDDFAAALF
jgi:hypothetical protein